MICCELKCFSELQGRGFRSTQTSPKLSFILKSIANNLCYHTKTQVIRVPSLLYFHRNNCGFYFVPAPEGTVLVSSETGRYYLHIFKYFP